MARTRRRRWMVWTFGVIGVAVAAGSWDAVAQEPAPPPRLLQTAAGPPPALLAVPAPEPEFRPMAINLATALRLADANAVDVAAAAQRERAAAAVLDQARVEWLPTITLGGDYSRHDGKIQNADGTVIDASRSSWMYGAGTGIGPAAILNINDAIFAPFVARQTVRARQADLQAARNDTLVAVTDAYFSVQQARGELAGAVDATRRTEELVAQTRKLAPAIVPDLEVARAEAELARRQQAELIARQRWQAAGADLLRLLRLDPGAEVQPVEPPHLRVDVVPLDKPVDDLIVLALLNRPELASQQAQVQATLALIKQERLRPLIPIVLIRGSSTPVTGTLAVGQFGGGTNGSLATTGARGDVDVQLLWQLDNLGFGNAGRVRQREAENRLAAVELFRVQDRVASEVTQAYTQAKLAAGRVGLAEAGVKASLKSADENIKGMIPRGIGGAVTLQVRPQEAVAAVQALAQAYSDYYDAVADYDRAQFRLFHALGHPAQALAGDGAACAPPAAVPAQPFPATALPPGRQ